jgi:methyltransferase family protein
MVNSNETSLERFLIAQHQLQGWLYQDDVLVFQQINAIQSADNVKGDLLEIGVYHGKSAILMGYFVRDDERFVVCDLFESPAPNRENQSEKLSWYPELTQRTFEENYLRFHAQLPAILACPSTSLIERGALKDSFRFIHIDGSHIFSVVRSDIRTAKALLNKDGIVAIDDYRSVHTPGVAAAVWEAVTSDHLVPICLTPQKMYATWNSSNTTQRHLLAWADQRSDIEVELETICDSALLRLKIKESAND